jgi:hypothetical protein
LLGFNFVCDDVEALIVTIDWIEICLGYDLGEELSYLCIFELRLCYVYIGFDGNCE